MEASNAATLVANGYVAVAINYRLSGEAKFPAAVNDAKAAVRYIRAKASEYRINPDKIGVWGPPLAATCRPCSAPPGAMST